MRDYIISILLVSLCSGIASHIFPESDKAGIGINLKIIGSLCIVSAIILPMTPFFNNFGILEGFIDNTLEILKFEDHDASDEEKYNEIFKDELLNGGVRLTEEQIKKDVCKIYSIREEDCAVVAEITKNDKEDLVLTSVRITLCGDAIWKDPYSIETFIKEKYGCDCAVFSSSK